MIAVIFDMDGVIVDSEQQWKLAEGSLFRRLVPSWTDAEHKRIVGLGVVEVYELFVKEYGLREPKESFLAECHNLAVEIYGQRVSQTRGIDALLADLKKNDVPLGLASSSPRAWIDIVLARFELWPEFSAVVSGDEVPGRTKPAPDIYLLAAERLGYEPGLCVAIEDSRLGVASAKSAGMLCAAFRNGFNEDQDLSQADLEFRSFAELSYDSLISRLSPA